MERVWIGIGSNLLDPRKQVDYAIRILSELPRTKFVFCSKYYRSRPLSYYNQPDFLNMVLVLDTALDPELLLSYTQKIERKQGRTQKSLEYYYWQPRTLDLDILLFGKHNINSANLIVPHYDMQKREFVMYPLFELHSNLILSNNKCISDIIKSVPKNGLTYWKN